MCNERNSTSEDELSYPKSKKRERVMIQERNETLTNHNGRIRINLIKTQS